MSKNLSNIIIENDIAKANYQILFKGIWTGLLISLIVHQALKALILFSERSKKLMAKVIIIKGYFIKSLHQLIQKWNEQRLLDFVHPPFDAHSYCS